ncbi:hypothetical protein HOT33_gp012 [Escherichia phage Gostya9]|uniref:Uncharacterized protein n=1 Tax=Escherichia phage Gostya9 TaxID=2182345 RepID=A0A2U8UWW5_9CAUD|nr:hypothetical protein HOT33_gp012 [Escherichia phage Gostya9]AWN08673.1 hypothetical protein T59_00012 [Escherichia phage Gostya9]
MIPLVAITFAIIGKIIFTRRNNHGAQLSGSAPDSQMRMILI